MIESAQLIYITFIGFNSISSPLVIAKELLRNLFSNRCFEELL